MGFYVICVAYRKVRSESELILTTEIVVIAKDKNLIESK